MTGSGDLFDDDPTRRWAASLGASAAERQQVVRDVMRQAGLPRLGTSGAANAYLLLVGSEFGHLSTRERPVYSLDTMGQAGWDSLWQLRIGEVNPHYDPPWRHLRENTQLWGRLYTWLPEAMELATERALAMFAWANLSVTAGGAVKGTARSHAAGMDEHVAPFIEACGARIVAGTNLPAHEQVERWARACGGAPFTLDDMTVWRVPLHGREIFAARVGHPSRGVRRADFTRRVRALLRLATGEAVPDTHSSAAVPRRALQPARSVRALPTRLGGMAPAISDELLSLVRSTWRRLGGYLQAQNGGRYLKLMHPRFSVDRACVVVDLDRDGRFQHFTNVRITTLVEWHRVFREVAQAFEPYWPPDRGWQSNSRDNRIECEVRQVPDWRELVQRYLELCRDHWVSGR